MPILAKSARLILTGLLLVTAAPATMMLGATSEAQAQSNDWRVISRGSRGYTDRGRRSPGKECLGRYTFDLEMNGDADLRFRSEGRTFRGHYYGGNGQIVFERNAIRPQPRSAFKIDGELFPNANVPMRSGYCGNGYFSAGVPDANLYAAYERAARVQPVNTPRPRSGDGWVTIGSGTRGYTDRNRPSPRSSCRDRYDFEVQTNANLSQLRFRSDGRTFFAQFDDRAETIILDRSDVRPRPGSAFSMNGHVSGGSMFSGYCGNGYFQIRLTNR